MDKVKTLILAMVATFISACGNEDVDGNPPFSYEFVIFNESNHAVSIVTNPVSKDISSDTIKLASMDSFISKGYYGGIGEPTPFPTGNVILIFDDSIKHICHRNLDRCCMVDDVIAYGSVIDGPEVYSYRYALTDADYEYAKEHQYREEKSDE